MSETSPQETASHLNGVYDRLFQGTSPKLFPRILRDVEAMFEGRYLDYQKNDTPYHDLRHTLAVTRTFADIIEGRFLATVEPSLTPRQFELGVSAALLHDTGYLKLRSDLTGTGAKYTFTHVLRSCAVASSYLPPLGVTLVELDGVLGAIRATNHIAESGRLHYRNAHEALVGAAVATADYIGQMAAPDYVDDLPKLFAEFEESDDYAGVPPDQRLYRSADELIDQTPQFWEGTVLPKLDDELGGLYRYLARPVLHGANQPMQKIEANLTLIRNRTKRP